MRRLVLLLLITSWACEPASEAMSDASPEPAPNPEPSANPEPGACVSTPDFYLNRVYTPIFSSTCIACHIANGVAGDTRLLLRGPADVDADLAALTALAMEELRGTPTLLLKPSAAHPDGHGGGMVLSVGSQGYRDLARLADRLTGRRDACGDLVDPGDPGVQYVLMPLRV